MQSRMWAKPFQKVKLLYHNEHFVCNKVIINQSLKLSLSKLCFVSSSKKFTRVIVEKGQKVFNRSHETVLHLPFFLRKGIFRIQTCPSFLLHYSHDSSPSTATSSMNSRCYPLDFPKRTKPLEDFRKMFIFLNSLTKLQVHLMTDSLIQRT